MDSDKHSDKSDQMFTVVLKRVSVQFATVYVRAKDRNEAANDALAQITTATFDESQTLGVEIDAIHRG